MRQFKQSVWFSVGLLCCMIVFAGCSGGGGGDDDSDGAQGETADCINDTSPTDNRDIQCDGFTFTVSVPDGCEDGGCGLIVDVHGRTMNADIQNAGTNMRQLGRESTPPYIVVQPNANGAPPSWSNTGGDDDRVVDFILEAIEAWEVDADRVHFGGYSQGGFMTWRMLCNHADIIASFAPIAGGARSGGQCVSGGAAATNPDAPILHVHGRDDTTVPFAEAARTRDDVIAAMGAEHQAEVLVDQDGTIRTRHTGSGLQYDLLEHPEGHCLPGGGGRFGCARDVGFGVGEVIIQFYINHPRN